METFRLGLLILTSEASDAIWSSRPHGWHVGIHQTRFPECGSGPPATTSGEACEICISRALPQTCWGPRKLDLKPTPRVSLMSTQV